MHQNLDSLNLFKQLKEEVLCKYKDSFPYWEGTLEDFGNKEIAELQELIEAAIKQRISEKWVYTHLKPTDNEKLPREDMLNILSVWVGYSGWDEFRVKAKGKLVESEKRFSKKKGKKILIVSVALFVLGFVVVFGGGKFFNEKEYVFRFYDQYTQKEVLASNFSVDLVANSASLQRQKIVGGRLKIKSDIDNVQLKIVSPYYKDELFSILFNKEEIAIYLQPDDYAMMLRMCMNSEKDWEKRREQLEKIISDEAEIVEIMYDDIGVEFLNKEEFIDKITIPIESTNTMEIVDILYSEKGKITALKFIQKSKNGQ